MKMRKRLLAAAVVVGMAALVTAAAAPTFAAPTAATTSSIAHSGAVPTRVARQLHHFRGTVTGARRGAWFWMRTRVGQTIRVYTSGGTRWHGCDWNDVHRGYHMNVYAYRDHGRWMATRMQEWRDHANPGTHQRAHHGDMGDHHGADHGPGMMD